MNKPEETMNEFERQLAQALRRIEAPATLSGTVLRIAEQEAARDEGVRQETGARLGGWADLRSFLTAWQIPSWMGGAVAAVLVVAFLAAGGLHLRRVQQESKAEQEYATAQQIEQQALAKARANLQRQGILLDQ